LSVIAIEFESTSIKCVCVKTSGRKWRIVHHAIIPLGEVARYPEGKTGSAALSRLLLEALPPNFSGSPVIVGLSGRATMLRFVAAPSVSESRLESMMAFEAESSAVGSKGGLSFDYLRLGIPGVNATDMVALSVAQNANIAAIEENLHRAGAKKVQFSPSAIGLYNAFIQSQSTGTDENVLIADIGANNVSLVLVSHGKMAFARTVSGGGARITSAIADALGIGEKDAEEIKLHRSRAFSDADMATLGEDEKRLARAISSGISIIGGAIDNTIMYCRTQPWLNGVGISKLFITGGAAKMVGIENVLSARLKMPVERLNVLGGSSNLDAEIPQEFLSSVIGVALGGLGRGEILELKSSATREAERYRRHDMYLWVAGPAIGAMILVFIGGFLLYGYSYDAYAKDFQDRTSREKVVRDNFDSFRGTLDLISINREYLLAKTSSSAYFLELLLAIKATLDSDTNKDRFKTLFFMDMTVGEAERPKKNDGRTTLFGPRTTVPEAEVIKYPKSITLTGLCRASLGSSALELARQFCLELDKNKDLIEEFNVVKESENKVDDPSPAWRNMIEVKFRIELKMKK